MKRRSSISRPDPVNISPTKNVLLPTNRGNSRERVNGPGGVGVVRDTPPVMRDRISTPTGSPAKVLHSAPIEEGGDDARNSRSLQGSPSRQLPQLGGAAGGMRVRVRVQDVGARSSGSGRGSNLPTSQRQRKRCAKCHLKAEGDLRFPCGRMVQLCLSCAQSFSDLLAIRIVEMREAEKAKQHLLGSKEEATEATEATEAAPRSTDAPLDDPAMSTVDPLPASSSHEHSVQKTDIDVAARGSAHEERPAQREEQLWNRDDSDVGNSTVRTSGLGGLMGQTKVRSRSPTRGGKSGSSGGWASASMAAGRQRPESVIRPGSRGYTAESPKKASRPSSRVNSRSGSVSSSSSASPGGGGIWGFGNNKNGSHHSEGKKSSAQRSLLLQAPRSRSGGSNSLFKSPEKPPLHAAATVSQKVRTGAITTASSSQADDNGGPDSSVSRARSD